MRLCEFFGETDSLTDDMRSSILDILTPLASKGREFVSLSAVTKKLEELHPGISIDRDIAMQVLDPMEVKIITKIEGDKVYLAQPSPISSASNEKEAKKKADKVKDMAAKGAKKSVQK